jgi:endonuclease G
MNEMFVGSRAKISMEQLQQIARDPEFPESELKQFFIADPEGSRPFAPAILPNPARVDVAAPLDAQERSVMMDWANALGRQRRQALFRLRRARGDNAPVLVSEGDSWFQFPLLLEDVIDQLSDAFNIWSVDAAGDTLENMVVANPEYLQALNAQAGLAKAFLFSGGGNDFLGADEDGRSVLSRVLKRFEKDRPAPWYLETDAFASELRFAEQCYAKVFVAVARAVPGLPVICHGYDYAIPGGGAGDPRHPVYAAQDQWIGAPMRALGIEDPALQRAIVRLMIDRFNERLLALCGGSGSGAHANAWYVDARGTLPSIAQWADELHPNDGGFGLVAEKFRATIARAAPGLPVRPATPRAAVAGAAVAGAALEESARAGAGEAVFDAEQTRAATARWQARASARDSNDRALEQGKIDAVETRDRLTKRINRLLSQGIGQEAVAATPDIAPETSIGISEEDVSNDLFERVIGPTRDFLDIGFFDRARAAARAVCRIVTKQGGKVAFGTGFMVSPSLVLTNHHVFPAAEDAAASVAEFDYAHDAELRILQVESFRLAPDKFFLTDATLDFSLVAVEEKSRLGKPLADYGFLPLIADEGKIVISEPVNIVQHPRGEPKQVVVRESTLRDMPHPATVETGRDLYAYYTGDTDPGSSGSPVFNDQWEVIALHHSGVPNTNQTGEFLDKDGNVWRRGDPVQIDWIANEGVRVSRLMAHFRKAFADLAPGDGKRAYLEDLFRSSGEPGLAPDAPRPPAAASAPAAVPPAEGKPATVEQKAEAPAPAPAQIAASHIEIVAGATRLVAPLTITVAIGQPEAGAAQPPTATGPAGSSGLVIVAPLTITVAIGRPEAGVAQPPTATGPSGLVITENFAPDPDYDSRPGYQADFLGFDLPLPTVDNSVAANVARLADGGGELKYHHYSVIMNARRRLAFVSAVNVDVDARAQIGREGADRWSFDPRLPRSLQTGAEVYKNNPLDKGHLTRRQDGAWGETQQEAQQGNDDTFHWTNCSPQHETFNQSQKASQQGLLLWGNLENHVTEQAKLNKRRISVFNGPVFRDDDADYRGIKLPRQFWKLIAMAGDDGKPNAVGFLLSQAELIADLPAENFDPGAFQPFQVKITEIERLSRLDFGTLYQADPLNAEGAERFFESGTAVVALASARDIVLHNRL